MFRKFNQDMNFYTYMSWMMSICPENFIRTCISIRVCPELCIYVPENYSGLVFLYKYVLNFVYCSEKLFRTYISIWTCPELCMYIYIYVLKNEPGHICSIQIRLENMYILGKINQDILLMYRNVLKNIYTSWI